MIARGCVSARVRPGRARSRLRFTDDFAPRAWSLLHEVYFSSAIKDRHERRLWIARESRLCPRSVIRDKERRRKRKPNRTIKKRKSAKPLGEFDYICRVLDPALTDFWTV